jgi:long-chain acyl-CoA synthetase
MSRTVVTMLREAARRYADTPYLSVKTDTGWRYKSFAEAEKEAREFAAALIARGFQKNDTLAILAHGSANWVIGELGSLLAGCISVPLSVQLLPEEIPFRLNHSGVRALLVSRHTLKKALAVLDLLENRDLELIYLEDDGEGLEDLLAGRGADVRRRITLFRELTAEGLARLKEQPGVLEDIEAGIAEDDVVTISYTSGTTGNPKGIMLTHLNYFANCSDAVTMFDVPEDFRTLVILPCDHSFAHTVAIYAALLRGISISFVDSRGGPMGILRSIPVNLTETNPSFLLTVPALSGNFMKKIRTAIAEKGGIIAALFDAGLKAGVRIHGDGYNRPPLWVRVWNAPVYRLAERLIFRKVRAIFGIRIQFLVGGGALLDVKQQEFFLALGVPVYQGYGLTEAAPVISSNTPRIHKLGSSGRVAPSVQCRILKADGEHARVGETGEIVIHGENVMKGYFRNPEASAQTVRDGWLYTGDLGYFDEDGFLVVVGREKALLIAEDGEKYSPEEIEEAIVNCSGLIAQVMLSNDQRRYTAALAVLDSDKVRQLLRDLKPGGTGSAAALLDKVTASFYAFKQDPYYSRRFPGRWIPATFRIVPEPFSMDNRMINSSMKMVRHKIAEAYGQELEYMYTPEGGSPDNPENLQTLRQMFDLG